MTFEEVTIRVKDKLIASLKQDYADQYVEKMEKIELILVLAIREKVAAPKAYIVDGEI